MIASAPLLVTAAPLAKPAEPVSAKAERAATEAERQSQRDVAALVKQLVQHFEQGDMTAFENLIHPAMVGHVAFMRAAREAVAAEKQPRLQLKDITFSQTEDAEHIRFRWEKRWLALPALAPQVASGDATFHFRREDKSWLMTGQAGDNPFARHKNSGPNSTDPFDEVRPSRLNHRTFP